MAAADYSRDGLPTTTERDNAVNTINPIWTPDDFRALATACRAAAAAELATPAIVIDIKTRKRLA
jgi:hypothetical protein